jgi:hypothetical protein
MGQPRSLRRATTRVLMLVAVVAMFAVNTASAASTGPTRVDPSQLRLVNYFPAATAQGLFWTRWSPSVVDADFAVISQRLHANAVRVFVPTDHFGWPTPNRSEAAAQLSELIALAAKHNLAVYLDLFNYYVPNSDISGSKRWAAKVLAPYAGDTRLAAIEVENEIDPSNPEAVAWARAMIPYVRSIAGGIPVAISVCGCDNTGPLQLLRDRLGSSQPDIYDFHYYPDPNANPTPSQAENVYQPGLEYGFARAKRMVAPATLIIGETGASTYYPGTPNFPGAQSDKRWEQAQAAFYTKVEAAARAVGIPPPAPWGYIDVAYGGGVTNTRQRFFGIFRSDGTPKPAAEVVANAFAV